MIDISRKVDAFFEYVEKGGRWIAENILTWPALVCALLFTGMVMVIVSPLALIGWLIGRGALDKSHSNTD